jgi:hypothetical protein
MSIDSENCIEYFKDCLEKFNNNFFLAIKIAISQNIFINPKDLEEDSGMSFCLRLLQLPECLVQNKKGSYRHSTDIILPFIEHFNIQNPYHIHGHHINVSSQVYYTDKRILRPTKWEQPFIGVRFIKSPQASTSLITYDFISQKDYSISK